MEIIAIIVSTLSGLCLALYTYMILGFNGTVKGCDSEALWLIPLLWLMWSGLIYFCLFYITWVWSFEVC